MFVIDLTFLILQAYGQEYKVSGLEESQEYEARVRTRTRVGLSPYSTVLQFGAVTHYSQPTKLSMSRFVLVLKTLIASPLASREGIWRLGKKHNPSKTLTNVT